MASVEGSTQEAPNLSFNRESETHTKKFQGASQVLPGCFPGASWVLPGCFPGAFCCGIINGLQCINLYTNAQKFNLAQTTTTTTPTTEMPELENGGKDCWNVCHTQYPWAGGKCDWCGKDGWCCKKGTIGNGCDGTFGGSFNHQCALKPGSGMYVILNGVFLIIIHLYLQKKTDMKLSHLNLLSIKCKYNTIQGVT